jgi:DNA invertase Pin-like site-specific DNA recombinase
MKRAVLYARVSTDTQQKEGTIASQVLELKRQIAVAGDVLVKEYVDERSTAASSSGRKNSKSTTAASRSSGSPAADSAAYRSSRSKNPG